MFEREYRELSFVNRWQTMRRTRDQSVAEHSYYVTLYALQIADLMEWGQNLQLEVARRALVHDAPEFTLGDWPGPAKRAMADPYKMAMVIDKTMADTFTPWPSIMGVGYGVGAAIKAADWLDMMFYLCAEYELGNRSYGRPMLGMRGVDENWAAVTQSTCIFEHAGRKLSHHWLLLKNFAPSDQRFEETWQMVIHQLTRSITNHHLNGE